MLMAFCHHDGQAGGSIVGAVGTDEPARPGDELLAAARAGDQDAFAAVVERHRRELLVHCYRMTGSLTDTEDLVQETFLRAWRGLGGFAGRSSLRAWLYRIATHACLDVRNGRIQEIVAFHDPALFPAFGLPATLPAQ